MGSATAPAGSPPKASTARDDHRTLLNHHMQNIRVLKQKADLAKAPYDAARENLTAGIDAARADLGKRRYTRKWLMGLLEDVSSRLRNLLAEEEQRHQDRLDLGLPVHGEQQSLFGGDETPDEAKDELAWEAEGYLFGRRGSERKGPEGCPPRFVQIFLKGWDRGQSETQLLYAEHQALLKRRGPNAEAPKDLTPKEPTAAGRRKAEKAETAAAAKSLGAPKPGAKGPELAAVDGQTTVVRTPEKVH